MDLIDAALRCKKPNPRFAYLAPYYAQAKDVAWTYVKQYGAIIPGAQAHESELRLDLPNGGRVRLYGADNYDRMRGIYLDGVILDEYGDMDPRVWPEVIRPALSDRKGWATFIGTPKGRNDFWRVFEHAAQSLEWFSLQLKASTSNLIDPAELADARAMMTPGQYAQEYECSFDAAIVGAYYAEQIAEAETEGRVGVVDRDPSLPVNTAWDLGIGDSTAIWVWQAAPGGMRILDHIEDHGKALPHYVAELNARGWTGGVDFVPHDAKARELGTGKTRVETLVSLGRNPRLVAMHGVADGINAVRQIMPRMWFNKATTAHGIEALRQYRTEYDEKAKTFRDHPRHDWTSHSADAIRYAAMAYRDLVKAKIRETVILPPGRYVIEPPEPKQKTRTRI